MTTSTTRIIPGLFRDNGGWAINVKHPNYGTSGAKIDGKLVTDGVTTAASAVFTSASAAFVATDVGKVIRIDHAALTAGSGTVAAAAGVATFSVSQAQYLTNGSKVVVAGTAYTVSAYDGNLTATLSGAPTFGASAFSVSSVLLTTILSYTNATTVALSVNAGVTLTAATTLFGTDDAAAIQAAIDAAMATGLGEVWLPAGNAICGTTLHAGYGISAYGSVVLRGAGYKFRGAVGFNGTAIYFTQSDRPGINFQGARGSRLKNIALVGPLFRHIQAQQLATTVSITDDTVAANWQDGALAATQESRYAPLAGVTIDAYAGAQPATHYPAVTYPGAAPQYNKLFSSDVVLDSVYIGGFNTAVANQPCDADGNGDFTVLRDCYLEMCKYGVSVGNSQSRNVTFEGVTKVNGIYAALVNNVHGKQLGKFGGTITNLSVFGCIHLFLFGSFYSGPMTFHNLYAESLWRLGTLAASSTNEPSLVFVAPELNFSLQTDVRGHPATVLDGGGVGVDIQIKGGTVNSYKSVVGFDQVGITFDGTFFRKDPGDAARANPYQYIAHNALGGGLVTRQLNTPEKCRLKIRPYNVDAATALSVGFSKRWALSNRPFRGIPFYAESVVGSNEQADLPMPLPRASGGNAGKASFTSITLSNGTLTIVFSARTDTAFMQSGPLPGDVIWDDQTFSTFFVRSRTTTTVIAELQNNYKVVAGVKTPLLTFSTTVGSLYWRNARFYTPTNYTRGDFTPASATVSSAGRDDGVNAYMTTDIVALDALAVFETRDFFISQADAVITAVAAGSLTLTGSAATRAQTRRRLDFFIAAPPANV